MTEEELKKYSHLKVKPSKNGKRKDVTFIVSLNNRMYDKIAQLAGAMDFGITGITAAEDIQYSYSTTATINETYIKKMKQVVKLAFEDAYPDFRVLNVKFVS